MLCNAAIRVLALDKGKTWLDVRRELSDAQVKKIHDLYAGLWPVDTQLPDMLPRPQPRKLRAVFMGAVDSRTLPANVTALLEYFDEVVVAHPFLNAATIKPEYSPSATPASFKEQTLRNVYTLMLLEPDITAGRVHLIPDPVDFDVGYRREMWAMAEQRRDDIAFSSEDQRIIDHLSHDDFMRRVKRLPEDALRSFLQRKAPEVAVEHLPGVIQAWKQELEDDPLALLQSVIPGEEGTQTQTIKGFNLETGMFVASLTGAILYADMEAMWSQLHTPDGDQRIEPAPEWQPVVTRLANVVFPLPLDEKSAQGVRPTIDRGREFLHALTRSVRTAKAADAVTHEAQVQDILNAQVRSGDGDPNGVTLAAQFEVSIPAGGFRRKDVTRLLLTFGRSKQVQPIPLAIMVRWKRPT